MKAFNRSSVEASPVIILLLGCAVTAHLYALFVSVLPTWFGGYDDQRLVLCALLVCQMLGCLVFNFLSHQPLFGVWRFNWPLLLFGSSFLVLALFFRASSYALTESTFYLLFFLAIPSVSAFLSTDDRLQPVVLAVILFSAASCFVYAAMTFNIYLFAMFDGLARIDSVIPWGSVNIRYWSHLATWLLPLLPLALLSKSAEEYRLCRLGVLFAGGVWWWIVLVSGARGTLLGISVAMASVWFLFGRASLRYLRLQGLLLFLGLGIWVFASRVIPELLALDVEQRSFGTGSSGRLGLWNEAWLMSLKNFPLGMGPQAWLTHEWLGNGGEPKRFGHPHNMYLMWAAEYGWLLLGFFLFLVSRAIWILRRGMICEMGKDFTSNQNLIAFLASVIAALTHAGFSAIFIAPASMLLGAVILPTCWALIVATAEEAPKISAPIKGRFARPLQGALIAVGACLMVFWLHSVYSYLQESEKDRHLYKQDEKGEQFPRFWLHGNFPRLDTAPAKQ